MKLLLNNTATLPATGVPTTSNVHFDPAARQPARSKASNLTEAQQKLLKLSPLNQVKRALLRAICTALPKQGLKLALHHFSTPRARKPYTAADLPEGASPFTLPFKKGDLKGYTWGTGTRVVYLMHGWESHLGNMTRFVEPLTRAGFKVVAFDVPGHGHSSKQHVTLRDIGLALKSVMKHHGKAHAVIAHSCGAAATALLLREGPNLTPEALVLIAPMKSVQNHLDIFNRIARLPLHLLERLEKDLETHLGVGVKDTDVAVNVAKIKTKGLLVHDRTDAVIPFASACNIASAWTDASFHATTGLGHRKVLRDSSVIETVTSFITETGVQA